MKENGKKPGPCHVQHVEVLNHLTDTLKDELKRGLTLLDNCVNQLAQAKWILINVERTMEDFYTDCPACDGTPKGTRATTPPPATLTTQPSSSGNAVSKKSSSSKAKKASVLPMVSGHTVQRPKINIARVDARSNKRSKRAESTSGGRGRSRGSASTAIPEGDDQINEPLTSVTTPSRKKLKPGPRSKTRIIANGGIPASSFVVDGNDVAVELEDIGYLLEGRETLKGSELSSLMGGDVVNDRTERASSSNILTSEKSEKKRKIETSDNEADSTSIKKKTEDKSIKLKPLASLKSSSTTAAATTIPVKPEIMKSLIQQTFLKFTKGKQPPLPKPKTSTIPPKSDDTVGSSRDKKGNVSDDSSFDKNKKEKSDQEMDKKMTDESDDENLATSKQKRSKTAATINKRGRKKNNSSGDDSDYEVSKSANKRSTSKRGGGGKAASNNLSDNDSSEAASFSLAKRKSVRSGARSKMNLKDSSDESSTAGSSKKKSKTKSPDRRSSIGKDENKSSSRRESKDDDKHSEKSSEYHKSKSPERNLPVVSKVSTAKRTGGRPGPKSVKLREQEKEKQQRENNDKDANPSNAKKPSAISSAVVFTDSEDSNNAVDSLVRATIKNIPLDLQDAVRSPSPPNAKDIFGKLLSTYNSSQQSGSFEKLKNRAKPIKNKVFELDADLQEKLSSVGRELVPYTGSMDVNKNTFVIGKYYIIGKGADEKLVFFDSSQDLQELDLAPDDIDELLDD